MKISVVVVVSNKIWARTLSAHLRGYPAAHAVINGSNKTLCGIFVDDGTWSDEARFDSVDIRGKKIPPEEHINCKRCKNKLSKLTRLTAAQQAVAGDAISATVDTTSKI